MQKYPKSGIPQKKTREAWCTPLRGGVTRWGAGVPRQRRGWNRSCASASPPFLTSVRWAHWAHFVRFSTVAQPHCRTATLSSTVTQPHCLIVTLLDIRRLARLPRCSKKILGVFFEVLPDESKQFWSLADADASAFAGEIESQAEGHAEVDYSYEQDANKCYDHICEHCCIAGIVKCG